MVHLSTAQLTERVATLAAAPTDNGTVTALLVRPETDERELRDSVHVIPGEGIVGDNYLARGSSRTEDGSAEREAEICMMNAAVLDVIADGDRDRWALAGDQFMVDFDLSTDNLDFGDRLSIGTATFEVSVKPHRGCAKFSDRFGMDARKFANSDPVQRYRGLYLMVVTEGDVAVGDTITKLDGAES